MDWIAHLPAGVGDLTASLANCARLKSVHSLLFGQKDKDRCRDACWWGLTVQTDDFSHGESKQRVLLNVLQRSL